MITQYRVVIYPEHPALVEMKKRIYDYCKELKILEPTMNDPFLTIKTEFEFESDVVSEIEEAIKVVEEKSHKFDLHIMKIDSYPKREFFYRVERSSELRKLHLLLIHALEKRCGIKIVAIEGNIFPFTIPIIFGDMHKDDFDRAALMLESYSPDITFEVNNISLVRKEGKFWKIHKQFFLKVG